MIIQHYNKRGDILPGSMKKRGLVQSPFLFILLCTVILSPLYNTGSFGKDLIISDSMVYKGLEYVVVNNYYNAMKIWETLEKNGYKKSEISFYRAVTLQSKMADLHNYNTDREEYLKYAEECIKLNGDNLNKNSLDIKSLYLRGSMLTSLALYYAETDEWMNAASSGLSGISHLKKINSINKNLEEPLLFINIFKYYSNRFALKTPIISLVRDDREEAILNVARVIDTGINSFLGRNQLAWMLIDYVKYDQAIAVSLKGLTMFPDSRFYLWTTAEAYQRKGEYGKAILYYKKVELSLRKDAYTGEYAYIKCLYKMLECSNELERAVESDELIKMILSLEIAKTKDKRVKRILKNIEKIQEEQ